MQKKLLALAIAGLAAMPALADDNVTIYGRIDMGFLSRGDGDGGVADQGTKNEIASGIGGGSRIGFRGTEDLGNGLKALFEVEFGIDVDNGPLGGSATWKNRHSYVGLTGDFGTVIAGRVDGARYGISARYDPFNAGTVASMASIQGHATRADNAIAYISPRWNGFGFLAAYTNNLIGQEKGSATVRGNEGDTQLYAIAGFYDNGPISLTLDYEHAEDEDVPGNSDVDVWVVAGTYDFGVAKIHGYWDQVDTNGAIDSTVLGFTAPGLEVDKQSWMIGATVPFGKTTLRASYIEVLDDVNDDADCKKFGIGVLYSLSKRTSLYADFATIDNDTNAACAIGVSGTTGSFDGASNPTDPTTIPAGYGTRGFDFGIAHTF